MEARPRLEKSNAEGNDGSEENDNPKEDQTTKDIHKDKNDVGDVKKDTYRSNYKNLSINFFKPTIQIQ